MALGDKYATVAQYKARATKSSSSDDTEIDQVLTAVTRLIERQCGRFFNQDASAVTRLYDGNGRARLYVDDIATLTGLVVKVDLNGDYDFADADEELTKDTHYWVGPANADKAPEPAPWRFLEVVPDNSRLGIWPDQRRAVQVTAKFGWPAVPAAIREATVLMTREIFDLQQAGFTLALQDVDQAVNLSPTAMSVLGRIKGEYGNAVPSF